MLSSNNPWILLKSDAFFNKIQFLNQDLTCISTRFFTIIRVLFRYTDNCTELCRDFNNTGYGKDE